MNKDDKIFSPKNYKIILNRRIKKRDEYEKGK